MRKPRLVVFAKAPVIGGAKTRLAAGVGRVEAWRLHRAMTAGLLRRLRDPRWETVLAVAPDPAVARRFPGVWPDGLRRLPQGGGDLGDRQGRAFTRRGPSVVIGSDAPDVTRGDLAAAFAALKRRDAVIGPAEDGGYWLIGLNGPAPAGLFDGVRWSSARTRDDLERNMSDFGISWTRLRTLADIARRRAE